MSKDLQKVAVAASNLQKAFSRRQRNEKKTNKRVNSEWRERWGQKSPRLSSFESPRCEK